MRSRVIRNRAEFVFFRRRRRVSWRTGKLYRNEAVRYLISSVLIVSTANWQGVDAIFSVRANLYRQRRILPCFLV